MSNSKRTQAAVPSTRNVQGAIPHNEVVGVHGALSKFTLAFLLLTAARSREVCTARWDVIDLDRAILRFPQWKDRSTARVLPLSSQALAVLNNARALNGGEGDHVSPR